MKKMGYAFIGMGLFFFGILPVKIPICFVIGGISALTFDKEIKL
jgi:hypothetical protein